MKELKNKIQNELKNKIQNELKKLCKKYKLYMNWELIGATESVVVSCIETSSNKRNKTIKILEKILEKLKNNYVQIVMYGISEREIFICEKTFYCATLHFEYLQRL